MLENFSYCPILHARVAEMKALRSLPPASKDLLFPLIVCRPWPNANSLESTWAQIEHAIGNRIFGLDLDPVRFRSGSPKPAAAQFDALFSQANGYENYYRQVGEIASAIPVLRIENGQALDLDAQIAHATELDRGLIVRVQQSKITQPLRLVQNVLSSMTDVAIVLDVGWDKNVLLHELWASGLIDAVSASVPEAEIVVCGSSFPATFTDVVRKKQISVDERALYDKLVKRHNAAKLIYGDWASTRPPQEESTPMKNVPRIDLPTHDQWIFFRRYETESYADIAKRTIADVSWPASLDIWGTYTILCTAEEMPGAIRSPGTAAAARINIHLHYQANFGAPQPISDSEEPFTDD